MKVFTDNLSGISTYSSGVIDVEGLNELTWVMDVTNVGGVNASIQIHLSTINEYGVLYPIDSMSISNANGITPHFIGRGLAVNAVVESQIQLDIVSNPFGNTITASIYITGR